MKKISVITSVNTQENKFSVLYRHSVFRYRTYRITFKVAFGLQHYVKVKNFLDPHALSM